MFKRILHMTGLVALAAPAFAAVEWSTDLEAAKAQAAASGKSILVDFTGSDWCGYCIRLKKDVFDTPEFEALTKDSLVFVEIDVPRDVARIGEELHKKNQALCKQYKVAGFPTIMIMSPEGYIIGGFVGGANMARVKDCLSAAETNAAKVKHAATLQGAERAKLLAEVHNGLPRDLKAANTAMVNAIVEADENNVTGMKDLAKATAELDSLIKALSKTAREPEKALVMVNEALTTCYPVNREELLMLKGQIIMAMVNRDLQVADSVEDVEAIKALMLQLVDCAPADRKEQMRQRVEKQFGDPAAVLEKIREQRALRGK
ncbi:MAG: thioredoxin family protein [Akkermansia sp.]|nr:thioredoxin family protein [Akkermansia sp.]